MHTVHVAIFYNINLLKMLNYQKLKKNFFK